MNSNLIKKKQIISLTDSSVQVRYKYTISRTTYSDKMLGTISAEPKFELKSDDPARIGLINMLDEANNADESAVVLKNLFPKFLKVKPNIFDFFNHFC